MKPISRVEYEKRQFDTWAHSKPIEDWRKQMKNPKSNRELLRLVEERCRPHGGSALDLGSGEGYHTMDLIAMGYDAIGLEFHKRRVADGKKLGRPVFLGDMHEMEYDDESFDLLSAHEVIEHSHDGPKVLREVRRVLKKGGRYAFSLPAEDHWKGELTARDNHTYKVTLSSLYKDMQDSGLTDFDLMAYELGSIKFRGCWKPGCDLSLNFRPHAFVLGRI